MRLTLDVCIYDTDRFGKGDRKIAHREDGVPSPFQEANAEEDSHFLHHLTKVGRRKPKRKEEVRVPLSKLRTSQPIVSESRVTEFQHEIAGQGKHVTFTHPPEVIPHKGNYLIVNGNHRFAAAHAHGAHSVTAVIHHYGSASKEPPGG